MKQLKVSLPDELRDKLERAAAASGRSLGEMVREKLEQGFKLDEADRPTQGLMASIANLAKLVRLDTGQEWHSRSAAALVLRHALLNRLNRLLPPGDQEPWFRDGELPEPRLLLAATSVEEIGRGLEALEAQGSDPEELFRFRDKVMQDFPQYYPRKQKEGGKP